MVAATNTYVQFIHFNFGSHYIDYLAAKDASSRRGQTLTWTIGVTDAIYS